MSGLFEGLHNAPVAVKVIISLGIPAIMAVGIGIALAFVKKVGLLTLLLWICNIIVTFFIFQVLPDFVRSGGPLVGALIFVFILLITYIIERFFTLSRSKGKGSMQEFTRSYTDNIGRKNFDGALVDCDAQGGSAATILKGAIQQVVRGSGEKTVILKNPLEIRRIFEEAVARETPLLERNLIALTTIASVATMIGLLGTTIGMIRAFQAMAHAGAPDAIMLATGISEALFNTAGGLGNAIIGIVANNYFVNRVDRFTYEINEVVYDTVDLLERSTEKK